MQGRSDLWLKPKKGSVVHSLLNDSNQKPGINGSNYTLEITVIAQQTKKEEATGSVRMSAVVCTDRKGLEASSSACRGSHKSNFLSIMHTQIKALVIKTLWAESQMMRRPLGGLRVMVCGQCKTTVVMSQQIDSSDSHCTSLVTACVSWLEPLWVHADELLVLRGGCLMDAKGRLMLLQM